MFNVIHGVAAENMESLDVYFWDINTLIYTITVILEEQFGENDLQWAE